MLTFTVYILYRAVDIDNLSFRNPLRCPFCPTSRLSVATLRVASRGHFFVTQEATLKTILGNRVHNQITPSLLLFETLTISRRNAGCG